MADGLNRVMLLGRLGADPELRVAQGGQAVLNMRLAINESYLDKDKVRHERVEWVSVVVWGKRGEALAKILTKGSSLFVEGSLRTSSYDDRDGNKRHKTEIHANNIVLTGTGRGGGEESAEPQAGAPRAGGGGYGRGGGRPAARPAAVDPAQAGAPGEASDDFSGGGYGGSDEDIPF
jgi:single-strand DNA-binding protein